MSTEEKILHKALEMFNERGVEYVGLRELAAHLDIRVSNITYYFPTKDDLVNQLSIELGKLNSKVMVADPNITVSGFLEMLRTVFYHHYKYRCLLVSFVHLMEQNKKIAARYRKTQADRNATLRMNLISLQNSGYLTIKEETDLQFLLSSIALVARFWISEARVSFSDLNTDQQVNHYLSLIRRMLMPHLSAKGKAELKTTLNEMNPIVQ